jgi:hypothetical protein
MRASNVRLENLLQPKRKTTANQRWFFFLMRKMEKKRSTF